MSVSSLEPRRTTLSGDIPALKAQFGERIRELRTAAGKTPLQIARLANMSQSRVSRIEQATSTPTFQEIDWMCEGLSTPPEEHRRLVSMLDEIIESSSTHRERIFGGSAERINEQVEQLERDSKTIDGLEAVVIGGFLQTAEYARCVLLSCGYAPTEAAAGALVRLRRQSILFDGSKQIRIIHSEAALRNRFTSPPAMKVQLQQLISLSSLNNVNVGVVPFESTLSFLPIDGFMLYDSRYARLDTLVGVQATAREGEIAKFGRNFTIAADAALWGDEARAFTSKIMNELPVQSQTPVESDSHAFIDS